MKYHIMPASYMFTKRIALVVALITVVPAIAFANPFIVDQSYSGANCGEGCAAVNIGNPVSHVQTFTPTFNAMDAVEVWVAAMTENSDTTTLRASVLSGGTVLGYSDVGVPDPPIYDRVPVHFDFLTPIALVPGNLYSLSIDVIGGELYGLGIAYGGDGYPWGRFNDYDVDLFFSEGLHPQNVPEPSLMVLLGISVMSIVGLRRWWRE